MAPKASAKLPLQDYILMMEKNLKNKVMPLWESLFDANNGGYNIEADSKHIVDQSRQVWFYSYMKIHSWANDPDMYLQRAKSGFDFLIAHFKDPLYGGYYWSTTTKGVMVDGFKQLYGHAFALLAMATYYMASNDELAKTEAMSLFDFITNHFRDTEKKRWWHQLDRNLTVTCDPAAPGGIQPNNQYTGDDYLHTLEAFRELYKATGDATVKDRVTDMHLNDMPLFYPPDPSKVVRNITYDEVVTIGDVDYGHIIEIAWMTLDTELTLGLPVDWTFFENYVKYVEANRDPVSHGVSNWDNLEWWATAEYFTCAAHAQNQGHAVVTDANLAEVAQLYMGDFTDTATGLRYFMLDTTDSGEIVVKDPTIHSMWKAGYHDTRCMVTFIGAYKFRQ